MIELEKILRKFSDIKIFELTNISINETLSRTIITSVTTLLALFQFIFWWRNIKRFFFSNDYGCNFWNIFINIYS